MSESAFKKTTCRHCGVNVEYPEEAEGQTANCPQCGKFISLPKSYPALPQSSFSESALELRAPEFVNEPKDVRTTEGEYVFLRAKAEGVPKPAYQWFSIDRDNNGQILPGETKPELLIVNPTIGIARYVVQAANSVGDVQSRVATLSVEKRAKFVEPQSSPAQVKTLDDIERQRRRLEAEKEQARINSASQAPKNPEEKKDKKENDWNLWNAFSFIFISWYGVCGVVTLASKMGIIGDYTNAQWNIWPKMEVWADTLLGGGILLCVFLSFCFSKRMRDVFLGISWCLFLIVAGIKYYPAFYPSPQQADVDYGVNWSLSHSIQWTETKNNLFNSYRVTNQYNEKVGSEKHYVYDFEAQCPVIYVNLADDGHPIYRQALGANNSIVETISGSVTLVRKGQAWYCSDTVRVH
jgi:hypothetical protein